MNPYPNLHDFSFLVFFALMSINFVLNYVEGLYFMVGGVAYAIANTAFLWITWLKRFSGNANYFYFQTIVFLSFLTLLYLQVFIGVDLKRKKYARELAKMAVADKVLKTEKVEEVQKSGKEKEGATEKKEEKKVKSEEKIVV